MQVSPAQFAALQDLAQQAEREAQVSAALVVQVNNLATQMQGLPDLVGEVRKDLQELTQQVSDALEDIRAVEAYKRTADAYKRQQRAQFAVQPHGRSAAAASSPLAPAAAAAVVKQSAPQPALLTLPSKREGEIDEWGLKYAKQVVEKLNDQIRSGHTGPFTVTSNATRALDALVHWGLISGYETTEHELKYRVYPSGTTPPLSSPAARPVPAPLTVPDDLSYDDKKAAEPIVAQINARIAAGESGPFKGITTTVKGYPTTAFYRLTAAKVIKGFLMEGKNDAGDTRFTVYLTIR